MSAVIIPMTCNDCSDTDGSFTCTCQRDTQGMSASILRDMKLSVHTDECSIGAVIFSLHT